MDTIEEQCRVCLSSSKRIYMSLFIKHKGSWIFDNINSITNLDIKKYDNLPDKICGQCLTQLEVAVSFRDKCIKSNTTLHSLLKPARDNRGPVVGKIVKKNISSRKEDTSLSVNMRETITSLSDTMRETICSPPFKNEPEDYPANYFKDEVKEKGTDISIMQFKSDPLESFLPNKIEIHIPELTERHDNLPEEKDIGVAEDKDSLKLLNRYSPSHVKSEPVDEYEGLPADNHDKIEVEESACVNKAARRISKTIDSQLECGDCGQMFKSKCKLRVHWNQKHLPEKLTCTVCKRSFKTKRAFNEHKKHICISATNFKIEKEGRIRMFHCKECSFKTGHLSNIKQHAVIHTGDKPFKCDLCSMSYRQLNSLRDHKETAHGQLTHQATCQYCGLIISGRRKIYEHLKQHKLKSVECPVCQKPLKSQKSLKQHMYRHTSEKQFYCEKCGDRFYTQAELMTHDTTTHKNILYSCSKCDYKAKRREIIKKHEVKHSTNNVPCTICGIFVDDAQALILHQRRHFEDKKYPCPYCGLKFMRKDTVPRHVRAKHPDVGKPAASVLVKKEKTFDNSNILNEND